MRHSPCYGITKSKLPHLVYQWMSSCHFQTLRPLQTLVAHAHPHITTPRWLTGLRLPCHCSQSTRPTTRVKAKRTTKGGLPEEEPDPRFVLIAVDPDTKGAIAVATWHSSAMTRLPAAEEDTPASLQVDLGQVEFKVFDMPCAEVTLVRKHKTTGRPIIRRTVDVHSARMLVMQSAVPGGSALPAPSNDSLTPPAIKHHRMQAFVEAAPIMPSDGKISTATTSYTSGLWHGLLSMGGFQAGNVSARMWKRDMGLTGQGKDASRLLAGAIFPEMQDLIALKKHHGRAEALLIAAWALGMRVDKASRVLSQGTLRSCLATDAYGNAVQYSRNSHVSDPDHVPGQGGEQKVIYADARLLNTLKSRAKELKLKRVAMKKKARKKLKKGAAAAHDDGEESE